MMAREPPWEQNGLPPVVHIMQITLAKSSSTRGASHQPAVMGSCLTISHTCFTCLHSRWSYILALKTPYDWTDGGSVDVFLNGEYGFTSMKSRCHSMEWVWNLRIKLRSQGCHTPQNSWKFEILLETPGKTFFFFIFPCKITESPSSVISVRFVKSVVLMRKKTVLPRMSRMGSLITFKHCHSLVKLISVWNRFSDKIKHCLE